MISFLRQKQMINAIMQEISSFRERVGNIEASVSVAKRKYLSDKESGNFSQAYLDREKRELDSIASSARKLANEERSKSRLVVDFRLGKLQDSIMRNFTELPRASLIEFIKLYEDMGEPLINEELAMLEQTCVNFAELRLLDSVSRRMARPDRRDPEASWQPSGTEPQKPTYQIIQADVKDQLKAFREFSATVHSFVDYFMGETYTLLPENAAPVESATTAAATEAFDGDNSPEKRLLKILENDYKRVEPGRLYSSSALTDDEIRTIDALLADSYDKKRKAAELASMDEDLRSLLIRDPRYLAAIVKAEEAETKALNDQIAKGVSC